MLEQQKETELCYIDEGRIVPNPLNHFSIDGIEEMAGSLRSYGIVTPLTVIGPGDDGTFRRIAGERTRVLGSLSEWLAGNREDSGAEAYEELLLEQGDGIVREECAKEAAEFFAGMEEAYTAVDYIREVIANDWLKTELLEGQTE